MKARPILFSPAMASALAKGQKTQTRRIMKPQPYGFLFNKPQVKLGGPEITCPYGAPGDLLWVRESWRGIKNERGSISQCKSTWVPPDEWADNYLGKWRHAMFMPRWASSRTLELTDVRIQRVRDIDEDDAKAEGAGSVFFRTMPDKRHISYAGYSYREGYKNIWIAIHGDNSWLENPFVWALTFKVHQQNIDAFLSARAA